MNDNSATAEELLQELLRLSKRLTNQHVVIITDDTGQTQIGVLDRTPQVSEWFFLPVEIGSFPIFTPTRQSSH